MEDNKKWYPLVEAILEKANQNSIVAEVVRGVMIGLEQNREDILPYNEKFDYLKFAKDVRIHAMNLRDLSDDSVYDIPRDFIFDWLYENDKDLWETFFG